MVSKVSIVFIVLAGRISTARACLVNEFCQQQHPTGVSEQDLVREHLLSAYATLSKTATTGISTPQRRSNLELLKAYADARRFPKHDSPVAARKPRFMDGNGNLCAVARLVTHSDPAAAAAINASHEFDYVADMKARPELLTWQATSGLTLDELALIQPSYSFYGYELDPCQKMLKEILASLDARLYDNIMDRIDQFNRCMGKGDNFRARSYVRKNNVDPWAFAKQAESCDEHMDPDQEQAIAKIYQVLGCHNGRPC
eukprot:TRINITY_DN23044_c0_g1_i1.p1 TRINITY_DN23044_c0_g1~~TRINITY_DN23044_c0_g1_i1.p1  ORF type:complete len:257 (-),score=12.12 TRINITY_DN23044_c0_g1_i1:191-961(-)